MVRWRGVAGRLESREGGGAGGQAGRGARGRGVEGGPSNPPTRRSPLYPPGIGGGPQGQGWGGNGDGPGHALAGTGRDRGRHAGGAAAGAGGARRQAATGLGGVRFASLGPLRRAARSNPAAPCCRTQHPGGAGVGGGTTGCMCSALRRRMRVCGRGARLRHGHRACEAAVRYSLAGPKEPSTGSGPLSQRRRARLTWPGVPGLPGSPAAPLCPSCPGGPAAPRTALAAHSSASARGAAAGDRCRPWCRPCPAIRAAPSGRGRHAGRWEPES
jgi:hypothetical protein